MADRHRDEIGFLARAAFEEALDNQYLKLHVASNRAGFCRWRKRKRDGVSVIYEIVSEKRGAGRALLMSVPLPLRLKTPIDLPANGFYEHMGGHLERVEEGNIGD
jgi:hypothetical protein